MDARKIVGALLLIAGVAIYLTFREEGREKAFGGALAPMETVRVTEHVADDIRGGNAISPTQTDYGRLVKGVRERVGGAMDRSERRAGR